MSSPSDGLTVIGIDPGPLTGVLVLDVGVLGPVSIEIAQLTPNLVVPFLRVVLRRIPGTLTFMGLEEFRDGQHARGSAAAVTRRVVDAVTSARLTDHTTKLCRFPAATHKPWNGGGDRTRGGLVLHEGLKKMPHARSAGQVAMFVAVRDAGLPDPLGRNGKDFW